MPLTLPLRAVAPNDVSGAGGKGANLASLVRAGLPVPPGFVVFAAAYGCVVAANDLQDAIKQHAQTMLKADATGAAEAAAAISASFMAATLPEAITEATLAAYRELGAGTVAVRSSATAENLPNASFAGQHETLLNVFGDEALLRTLRACWASLWTPQAVRYREAGRYECECAHGGGGSADGAGDGVEGAVHAESRHGRDGRAGDQRDMGAGRGARERPG